MSVEIGAKVTGKVTGITNFGAFVDLGEGKSGLVHISEISDHYVKDIHDVLTVGDEVTVKVLSVDNGKIGLSIRKASDNAAKTPSERPQHHRVSSTNSNHRPTTTHSPRPSQHSSSKPQDFDSLLSSFLKESEDRLTAIKRNTEGKRGGRGGRRS